MSDITYSWNEYIRLNEELVYKVAKSGWQFDCLICLSRGGTSTGAMRSCPPTCGRWAHTLQRKTDSKAAKESERWQGVNGTTTSGGEGA